MYDVVIEIMDAVMIFFWGWCLCRFCGTFLELKRLPGRNREAEGAVSGNFVRSPLKNGWPVLCFWVVLKWLTGHLETPDSMWNYDNGFMLLKTLLLYGVLYLFLRIFYKGRRGALPFSFVTLTAVSEISRFLAYAVSPLGNWFIDLTGRMLEKGKITDLEFYMRLITVYSCVMQALMNAVFMGCLWGTLRQIGKAFGDRRPALDRAELRFLLLPGCTGMMFCIFLRIILVTVEGDRPRFLYESYPLLMGAVPVMLLLCLSSILYSVRLFWRLRELHEEKERSVILEQQLESMEEHLRETERVYADVRAMKHDVKNQLAVVMELAEHSGTQEELQDYLAQLHRTLNSLDFSFKTGSAVVDTLVGIKYHEMEERIPGIEFQADHLMIPPIFKVSPVDLSLILGNGLDNAIEACVRAAVRKKPGKGAAGREAEPENTDGEAAPWIRVSTMMNPPFFFLEIANSFDGELRFFSGHEFPDTLKEDSSLHGIGLQSIKRTAQKYGGGVDWKAEEKVFTLTVMLKNEEIKHAL